MWYIIKDDELCHHGIKGQRWGVRRFQNPDGSLTSAGQKRYGNMDDRKLYKTLKKEVRNKRQELHGRANRWMSGMDIGSETKRLNDEYNANMKRYENTAAYKKANEEFEKAARKLDSDVDDGRISMDDYDRLYKEITNKYHKALPKKDFVDLNWGGYVYRGKGKEYLNKKFVKEGGAKMSVAMLLDLGYNRTVAEDFVKRMARSKYTLGDL